MGGSSIDFAGARVFTFDDESPVYPVILQKKVSYDTRHGLNYQMFELAAFCPFSIISDTLTNWIDYSPQNKPMEFKSLKYFLNSSRNVDPFKECIKSWICNGLNTLLVPA